METHLKKIVIGEIFIGEGPLILSTVLGSCVSVCIFSDKQGIGGIIHYALPDRSFAQNSSRGDLQFGNLAIPFLIKELSSRGLTHSELKAKIIGGANLSSEVSHSRELGKLNVEMARQTLNALKIPIVGEDVGGEFGREVYFYPSNGRLRVSKKEIPQTGQVPSKPASITKKKIKVMVIDDSKTIQQILTKILTSDDIEVVATAPSAEDAWGLISSSRPDVITLDIHMPGLNGVEFLEKFLPLYPIPTIMISSISLNEGDFVMKALELGAVDYIQKPTLGEIQTQAEFIREKVRIASRIKVQHQKNLNKKIQWKANYKNSKSTQKIIAIGSSTGGTEAVKKLLMCMPANIPPILIVQHIPPVFSAAFAKRLNELCPFEVKEAAHGDKVTAGTVLIAPGGLQMELIKSKGEWSVRVFEGEKVNRHRPSVDVLFNSVATLAGKDAVGIILTGMGDDGARGLLEMKKAGAYTISQDEASCVVYGMPKAAVLLNAVQEVCPLDKMCDSVLKALEKSQVA